MVAFRCCGSQLHAVPDRVRQPAGPLHLVATVDVVYAESCGCAVWHVDSYHLAFANALSADSTSTSINIPPPSSRSGRLELKPSRSPAHRI